MTIHTWIFVLVLLFVAIGATVSGLENVKLREENGRLRRKLGRQITISREALTALYGTDKPAEEMYTEYYSIPKDSGKNERK